MSLDKAINMLSTGIPSPPPAADTAVLIMLTNVILPGFGTLVTAGLTHKRLRSATTYVGIAQICTVGLAGIGWVWAIAWGVLLYKRSKSNPTASLPPYEEKKVVVKRWVWVPVRGNEQRWGTRFGRRTTPQVAKLSFG